MYDGQLPVPQPSGLGAFLTGQANESIRAMGHAGNGFVGFQARDQENRPARPAFLPG